MHVDQSSLIWNVLLSEIYVRAQRTDADRGFSDCSVSGILNMNNSAMVTKIEYTRCWRFNHNW